MLGSLDFPQDSFDDLDPANTTRLRVFLRRHRYRPDIHNYVPTIIDERSLRDALKILRPSRKRRLPCSNSYILELIFAEGCRL